MSPSKDKAQVEARAAALARFNRWEAEHPIEMPILQAISGVGTLYELIPLESRHLDIDPHGVKTMHQALAHLKGLS
jgi:hypothetical protein